MTKLETISGETCMMKLQTFGLVYLSEQMEKCKTCTGEYYVMCEKYRPVKTTSIPIRQGRFCYHGNKKQGRTD
jgi:hypothetical protein